MITLLVCAVLATACGEASSGRAAQDAVGGAAAASPSVEPENSPNQNPGFRPRWIREDGKIVMALTFVDGTRGDVVADAALGIQDMTAQIYTAGGLKRVDRTISFTYGDGGILTHEGPLETYEGYDGDPVEVWRGSAGDWECPNLVYGFGQWFVGVRTCQRDLSRAEKETWARSLVGRITDDGFLVLSAKGPLVLQETGGHEGPELILASGRANAIELEPGECNPEEIPDDGDIRTMPDGTRVSFSHIESGKIEYDWLATWCEDGLMRVQVSYAYEQFAEAAARGFRMREVVLAN